MNSKDAVQRGAAYLEVTQLPDGGFTSTSAPNKHTKQSTKRYQTTFFPSLILQALEDVHTKPAKIVKARIVDFLIDQKSSAWSFNYWDRQSVEYASRPYPDDLDDTFVALAALYSVQPELFKPAVQAAIAKLLISTEMQEGGPYRTWLTDSTDQVWHDVDVVVNTNIGHFLSLQQIELPSTTSLVEAAITGNALESPFYPNVYPLVYFMARWYRGRHQRLLQEKLLARKNGSAWQHPQRTALAITSLLKLGYSTDRLKPAVDYLLHLQQPDGSWEAEAFCIDPSIEGKVYYAHSRALSTALCMEALTLYEEQLTDTVNKQPETNKQQRFYKVIVQAAAQRIHDIQQIELKQGLGTILERITAQDTDAQIIMLPLVVARAFKLKPASEVIQQLATCSLWGWMAYSTYDDFLDGEGEASLLPAANTCLRYLVEHLSTTLPTNKAFHTEVEAIMNRLDAANAWELVNCRGQLKGHILHLKHIPDYGDYWQLADRSIGHVISALGVLYAEGTTSDASSLTALHEFMKHYLIARQLNDDAHDWYEDLLAGHVNAVGAMLLRSKYPVIPDGGLKIDIVAKKPILEQLLWEEIIDQACSDIKQHIDLARSALQKPGLDVDVNVFETFLLPLEVASELALQKRNEALEFIAAL